MRRLVALGLAMALLSAGCRSVQTADTLSQARTYRTVDGRALRAFVFGLEAGAAGQRPAVLLLHPGGWVDGTPQAVYQPAAAFARAGFAAVAVEYRLSDAQHSPQDALADVCAALQWTRQSLPGVDPSRVAIYGASTGGHLAAATATVGCPPGTAARGPDALLLLSPLLDVEEDSLFRRLIGATADARALSPLAQVQATMPPTSIAHGVADSIAPLVDAQRFCLQVTRRGATCDLRVYNELGHLLTADLVNQRQALDGDPVARRDALQSAIAFLRDRWLPDASPPR